MICPFLLFALQKKSLSPTGAVPATASRAACLQDSLILPEASTFFRCPDLPEMTGKLESFFCVL